MDSTKCEKCGWYEIGCMCGDSDKPRKLNRAQRRALKHTQKRKTSWNNLNSK